MTKKELRREVREFLGTKKGWYMAFPGYKDADIHFEDFRKLACVCVGKNGMIRHCHLFDRGICNMYPNKIDITFDIFDWLVRGASKTEIVDRVTSKGWKRWFSQKGGRA